ncbi:ABC transporter ATP-binding protein [Paracoccus litorisediminis]|uniref:ATP-binding cassette domain-containing protein n=1 Tax=Paracoccus litorisediminis TaxID=2006130 RepID=A0A844HNP5_9RHOB|nr:ABC transporter ATP-binding protein [Paracoccus litorisediminis]MTH61520.1 ATP-binding cassette domain-containing protein [Paracoccus litorisediminis]
MAPITNQSRGAEVRLTGLGRSYGDNRVVQSVDLTIKGGEILALLGPSGCGKTTTLRMIAGLIEPTEGDVIIDGRSVIGLPVHKRNLGMLFQDYALFPHLTVRENVAFGLEMRGVPKAEIAARADEALRKVRLAGFEARMPAQLSGGQRQRTALARAIVYQPRVLLLDEPFGALDRKLREEMQVELRALCAELGLTTIIVTHDQEEALILADRVAVMEGGRLRQVAPAQEIYHRPATQFVADFMGVTNLLPVTVTGGSAEGLALQAAGVICLSTVAPDLPKGTKATIAIRPESIVMQMGESMPQPNHVTGTVARTAFRGQALSVWLQHQGGEIVAAIPTGQLVEMPQIGTRWTASWPAARTLVVQG